MSSPDDGKKRARVRRSAAAKAKGKVMSNAAAKRPSGRAGGAGKQSTKMMKPRDGFCWFHGSECHLQRTMLGKHVCVFGHNRLRSHFRQVKAGSVGQWKQDKHDFLHRPTQWRLDNKHLLKDVKDQSRMDRLRVSLGLKCFAQTLRHAALSSPEEEHEITRIITCFSQICSRHSLILELSDHVHV